VPIKPPSACGTCGRAKPCACPKKSFSQQPRERDMSFYNSKDWRSMTSLLRMRNPICQRIESDGHRCGRPSKVAHHLIDPRDNPDLKLDWRNLVAVCHYHENRGQRGDDGNSTYAPTRWVNALGEEEFQEHPPGKKTSEAYISKGGCIVDPTQQIAQQDGSRRGTK
jgi:hypothetical protein